MTYGNEFFAPRPAFNSDSFAATPSFSYTLIPNIALPTAWPNVWRHQSEARGFGFPKRR
jgi:hypothetical protein